MRILEGNVTHLQLAAMVCRLCKLCIPEEEFQWR